MAVPVTFLLLVGSLIHWGLAAAIVVICAGVYFLRGYIDFGNVLMQLVVRNLSPETKHEMWPIWKGEGPAPVGTAWTTFGFVLVIPTSILAYPTHNRVLTVVEGMLLAIGLIAIVGGANRTAQDRRQAAFPKKAPR